MAGAGEFESPEMLKVETTGIMQNANFPWTNVEELDSEDMPSPS